MIGLSCATSRLQSVTPSRPPTAGAAPVATSHPTFPNPTLAEVVCELRFEPKAARPWDAALLRQFHKRIAGEYPTVEKTLELQLGDLEASGPKRAREKATYQNRDDARQLKMGEGTFSMHVVGAAKYAGWPWFKAFVEESWAHAREELGVGEIQRLGLRYINRVPRASAEEPPGRWLKETGYIAPALLKSRGRFLSRVECRSDAQNATIVTVGINQGAPDDPGALILDIDRIREARTVADGAAVAALAESLHGDIWDIFKEALSDEYLSLLKRGGASR
jgi:uncharacterized protein (TIGR04255 family)